jgi:hypothetical protein
MKIKKTGFVEHRSLSGFDLGPQWAYGGTRVLAPGACSCTSCCSCTAAISVSSISTALPTKPTR